MRQRKCQLGKILKAFVEPGEDGEYQLVTIQEIFENESEIKLPDGTLALKFANEKVLKYGDCYADPHTNQKLQKIARGRY
jgi:hypothetical protein